MNAPISYLTLTLLLLPLPQLLRAAEIPLPPWYERPGGPTSRVEIVEYLAAVLPALSEQDRSELDRARERSAGDGEILSLTYAARLRAAIRGTRPPPATTPTTLDEIQRLQAVYGDQWETLTQTPGAVWSTAAGGSNMISEVLTGITLCEELKRRIDNPADPLDDLDRYTPVFTLRGAAWSLYWKAEQIYWKESKARAKKVFELFLSQENNSGFTRGGAHFFLGKLYWKYYNDSSRAFKHFMKVHTYSSCLVLTAAAYYHAACILKDNGQYDNALALLAVDVPTLDMSSLGPQRHITAAEIELGRRNFTQAARHVQKAYLIHANCTNVINNILSQYPHVRDTYWDIAATNPWSAIDVEQAIRAGLSNPHSTPDDDLFLEALAHAWPKPEDIPAAIATNRVLNNNVFPYRKRKNKIFDQKLNRGNQ